MADTVSHTLPPAARRPLGQGLDGEEDSVHAVERKVKKKMQNRVAQRLYRQRMKTRVEELQAQVDMIQGVGQGGQARLVSAQPATQSAPLTGNAHRRPPGQDIEQNSSDEVLQRVTPVAQHTPTGGRETQQPAPIAQMVAPKSSATSPVSDPSIPGVIALIALDHVRRTPMLRGLGSNVAPLCATAGMDTTVSARLNNLKLQTPSYETDVSRPRDSFKDVPNSDIYDAPSTMGDMAFRDSGAPLGVESNDDTWMQSLSSDSSLSSEVIRLGLELNFTQDPWESALNETSWPTNPVAPQNSAGSDTLPPSAQTLPRSTDTVEDRLKYVSEQAKLVGFPDLDAVVMAYFNILNDGNARPLLGGESGRTSSTRRLPMLIAILRFAIKEWKDWEERGFPLN